MVFSSPIFLFIFLPAVLIINHLVPGIKAKNFILLIFSIVFYAFGQLNYLPLFLLSILVNYLGGLLLGRLTHHRRIVLALTMAANLLSLCIFKYADFLIETVNGIAGSSIALPGLILPIGISFFTFQGMSYVIDVYRDPSLYSKSFMKVALYISLFPQLVAGPIIIFHDVAAQIDSRSTNLEMTARGLRRFIIGLAKKLLIANTLGSVVDSIYAMPGGQIDTRLAWVAAIFYALQIYFDFSGYSDMAIGMGKMFGFSFMENFNYPYISGSVQEFWRRWHISLSSWFKDYLYIPLGGNRKGRARTILNKLIVFFLTGLWHGASWNFVIWGLWNGLFLILEDILPAIKKLPGLIRHISVLLVAVFGFVVFRAETLTLAGGMLKLMIMPVFTPEASNMLAGMAIPLATCAIAVVASTPIIKKLTALTQGRFNSPVWTALGYGGMALLFVACILNLASTSFNPFIYFQF